MLDGLTFKPDTPFTVPEGVSQIEVDKVSGYPAHDGFGSYKEWFVNGSLPNGPDTVHTKVKICKNDPGKLADKVSISQGNYDEKEFIVMREIDFLTNKSLWQKGIDDWISKQENPIYKPPTEVCGASAIMDVQIVTPENHSKVEGDKVTVRFLVVSSKPIVEARIYLDGNEKKVITSGDYLTTLEISSGQHSLRVTAKNNEGAEESKTIEFAVNTDYIATSSATI